MFSGVLLNGATIIAGAGLGLLFRKGINEKYSSAIIKVISLAVIVLGMKMALEVSDMLMMIIFLIIGTVLGHLMHIEEGMEKLGDYVQKRFGSEKNNISKGFVTASLLYCTGSMAIVGSLQSGLEGVHDILIAKAIMDGVMAVVLTTSLGVGVGLSFAPVVVYQGIIVLASSLVADYFNPEVITDMSAIGGVLLIALGLYVLKVIKIKVANMIPAMFLPLIWFIIISIL